MATRKTIKVTRTFVHVTRSTFPDSYGSMSAPAEAAAYEESVDVESAIEALYYDTDADALTVSTVVEVEDYEGD